MNKIALIVALLLAAVLVECAQAEMCLSTLNCEHKSAREHKQESRTGSTIPQMDEKRRGTPAWVGWEAIHRRDILRCQSSGRGCPSTINKINGYTATVVIEPND